MRDTKTRGCNIPSGYSKYSWDQSIINGERKDKQVIKQIHRKDWSAQTQPKYVGK